MMRALLCRTCSAHYREGTYVLYPATDVELEERARVVRGRAKQPTPAQRVMRVNDTPYALDMSCYNCDTCNGRIQCGEPAWCVTVWQPAHRDEPGPWEDAYLDAED